jgi:hypothetical protein
LAAAAANVEELPSEPPAPPATERPLEAAPKPTEPA